MDEYVINNRIYIVEKDEEKCFDYEEIKDKMTDYFTDFDYILGDIAYNKVRLKGFYAKNSKRANKINNINTLEEYLANYCAHGCKWFLLKKCD